MCVKAVAAHQWHPKLSHQRFSIDSINNNNSIPFPTQKLNPNFTHKISYSFLIMPIDKQQPIPPPVIGKIGYYTVFVTPKPNPNPNPKTSSISSPLRDSDSQKKKNYSPVQPPPVQYETTASSYASNFGFFWDAVAKLQNAHSNLDDHLAHWFGLNQSKYQWALDDYYENESMEKVERKAKDISNKAQK